MNRLGKGSNSRHVLYYVLFKNSAVNPIKAEFLKIVGAENFQVQCCFLHHNCENSGRNMTAFSLMTVIFDRTVSSTGVVRGIIN